MLPRKVHDLRHLGLGNLVRVDPADADALVVNMQHDARRVFLSFVEEPLKDKNDELHRREIVIEKENLVEARLLRFRSGLRDDAGL